MTDRPLRLTHEIPLAELGVACIYCGQVVEPIAFVVPMEDAARAGLELTLHADCMKKLSPGQVASAAAIRVCAQLVRGYYAETNVHGPMFERAIESTLTRRSDVGMQGPSGDVGVPVPPPIDAIEELFTYHAPTGDQAQRYLSIREAAKNLARVIDANCPAGPDRTAAIRHVREAVMTANASIATNNAQYR